MCVCTCVRVSSSSLCICAQCGEAWFAGRHLRMLRGRGQMQRLHLHSATASLGASKMSWTECAWKWRSYVGGWNVHNHSRQHHSSSPTPCTSVQSSLDKLCAALMTLRQ